MKLVLTKGCAVFGVLLAVSAAALAQTTTSPGRTVTGFAPNPVSGFNANPVSGFTPAPARSLGGNLIVPPPLPVVTNFTTGQLRFTTGSTPISSPPVIVPVVPTVTSASVVTTTVTADGVTKTTITPLF